MTALHDAIGVTARKLEKAGKGTAGDVAFLLPVVTDGCENASRESEARSLSELMKRLDATGVWTFAVLGAILDLKLLADNISVSTHNTMAFVSDSAGMAAGGQVLFGATASYMARRGQGETASEGFFTDCEARP